MNLPERTIKSLRILNVPFKDKLTTLQFAKAMWPDEKDWNEKFTSKDWKITEKGIISSTNIYLNKLHELELVSKKTTKDGILWQTSIFGKKMITKHTQKYY